MFYTNELIIHDFKTNSLFTFEMVHFGCFFIMVDCMGPYDAMCSDLSRFHGISSLLDELAKQVIRNVGENRSRNEKIAAEGEIE